MRVLTALESNAVAGGFHVTENGLSQLFGGWWNRPASLAVRLPSGATLVALAYSTGWTVGTWINNNFGGQIANAVDYVMGLINGTQDPSDPVQGGSGIGELGPGMDDQFGSGEFYYGPGDARRLLPTEQAENSGQWA